MPSAIPPAMRKAWCPTSVSPSQTNPPAISMGAGSVQRVTMRLMVAVIFMGSSELLGGGPDNDFIDFHIRRLLDCVSDRLRDCLGRNSHDRFVKFAQILSGRFIRTSFRKFCSYRPGRDHRAADIFGVQLDPENGSEVDDVTTLLLQHLRQHGGDPV